jgi:hypothetical protein
MSCPGWFRLLPFLSCSNHWELGRPVAEGLAGVAAISASLSPLFGWTAKVRTFSNMHFAYGQLFGQIELVVSQIRREGLKEEAVGASKLLSTSCTCG